MRDTDAATTARESTNVRSVRVRLVGLCSDSNSSFLRGAAAAPAAIRRVLDSGASNLTSESGCDLGTDRRFDRGADFQIDDNTEAFLGIENIVAGVLEEGVRPLILGGDHAITYPVVKAIARRVGAVELLHFDAHADIYDEYAGNRYSHASPFARIMEEGLARRLVQVGVRTLNGHQRKQVDRFGVEVHEARAFDPGRFDPRFAGPLYVSVDLDALDPAFAPGVSHHEPGGLSVRDVLQVIQALDVPVIGADIVEYNPARDTHDMTAAVAVKLVKEIAAVMLDTAGEAHS